MPRLRTTIDSLSRRLADRCSRLAAAERGDVPGWVLITLMTAGLVLVVWALASDALGTIFTDAIDRVTGAI